MSVRVPPGRSGRLWLRERLAVARRGGEILEQKLAALHVERDRLGAEAERAQAAWAAAYATADRWLVRAQLLAGEGALAAAAQHAAGVAEVAYTWRETMGVAYPVHAACTPPPASPHATLGGSAAVGAAADAYRDALVAAARCGALNLAAARIDAEIATTSHRLRIVERRWIPLLEAEQRGLRRRLDEAEREETARTRWIRDHPA